MRLVWYAGASTALAASVVLSAFHQRANFYSAMVYLSESNFCIIALVNFIYILYAAFMYGLQRLCFGQLRATEVDQLSDRAWVAITETCLAMTIFRDEIGAWFLVMFTLLVTGKVWGWIGDGRLEILEQQPPQNPRLFHTRIVVSLLMSTLYDIWLLRYCINSVVQQARPNMMVMFLFEFAVLSTSSLRTNARYLLTIIDSQIVASQTAQRIFQRRVELHHRKNQMVMQREADVAAGREPSISERDLPNPDDVDELDIEVPGWESKGQWVLVLELVIDFMKLSIYVTFFVVLLMFYGLPIHIIRDVYITASAFFKRLSSLLKYRRAIQSMNALQDATAEDLAREDTCIICREEMRVWDPQTNYAAVERTRPKKLACGHILHLGCLKSWLERQQVCPTCRRPVLPDGDQPGQDNQNPPAQQPVQGQQPQQQGQAPQHQPAQGQAPAQPNNEGGANGGAQAQAGPVHRAYNLGPFRLEFIRHDGRNPQALNAILNRARAGVADGAAAQTQAAPQPAPDTSTPQILSPEFDQVVNRELASLQSLQIMQAELHTAQRLLAELVGLRQLRQQLEQQQAAAPQGQQAPSQSQSTTPTPQAPGTQQIPLPQQLPPTQTPPPTVTTQPPPFSSYPAYRPQNLSRFSVAPNAAAIPSGSSDLPSGLVIPQDWSILPLSRVDANPATTGTPPPRSESAGPGPASEGQEAGPSIERRGAPVLAPNPVVPNWGMSQIFAQGSAEGSERRGREGDRSEQGGESTKSATAGGSATGTGGSETSKSAPVGENATSSTADDSKESSAPTNTKVGDKSEKEGESTSDEQQAPEGDKPNKGKARAVSVEDADDE